jgi:hypothetical protein
MRSCWPQNEPQFGVLPIVGCVRLHVECISSYLPYLDAVPSVR